MTSETPDVVSRLLAKIAEAEEKAQAALEESKVGDYPEDWGHWRQSDGGDVYYEGTNAIVATGPYGGDLAEAAGALIEAHDPHAVLRLCQAHREVIRLHSSQHEIVDAFNGGRFCVDCGADEADCTRQGQDDCPMCGMEPCATLRALAGGYGIQEDR